MSAHWKRLSSALAAEWSWTEAEHARQMALALPERVAAGVSWPPLVVRELRTERGRVRVLLGPERRQRIVLHEGIRPGQPVALSRAGAGVDDDPVVGWCLSVEPRLAELELRAPIDEDALWVVNRRLDAGPLRRYQAALGRAAQAEDPGPVLASFETGRVAVPEEAGQEPPGIPGSALNPPQLRALRRNLGLEQGLSAVQGPPGTGKTRWIAALAHALKQRGARIWLAADSNAAVDHMALRVADAGLSVVRLGRPVRMGHDARALSLEVQVQSGPFGAALAALDRDLGRATRDRSREGRRLFGQLRRERQALQREASAQLLAGADAIAGTLATLARWLDPGTPQTLPDARWAIVDEASQAIEPALVPLAMAVPRLVLVGDPAQLGPVVLQPGNPLERSLMERLAEVDGSEGIDLLRVQHRMHAAIMELVQPAYGGALEAHPSVAGHLLQELPGVRQTPLTGRPVLAIDTAGAGFDEQLDPVSRSLRNEGEARLVGMVLAQLREAGLEAGQIGVITPYSAQRALLREQAVQAGWSEELEIATVNAFQGREKECLVLSLVRSNDTGEVGFVADPRRLVVGLSRARRSLLIVGDSATLGSQRNWAALFERLAERGDLGSVWEEPWSEALAGLS